MNIVIVSILLPYPLNSGGAQAQFNLIDKLRTKHHITFVFPENGQNSISAMGKLQELWPEVTFRPYRYAMQLMDLSFFCSKMKRAFDLKFRANCERFKVERILKPYGYSLNARFRNFVKESISQAGADVVQVEFYPFLPLVDDLPANVLKVFVHHEIRYVRNERMLQNFTLTDSECKLQDDVRRMELACLNKFDRVVALTQNDKEVMEHDGVNVPIYVSPAAVDSERRPYSGWNGNVAFLGGYGHAPNQEGMDWFMRNVLPKVEWSAISRLTLDIVGKGWPAEYMRNDEKCEIRLHGFVERLSDVMCGSIMIIPLLSGSGMRMKILEASALGVPFITTSVGVEGLKFEDEESCLIADTEADFAKAIVRLMSDEVLRKRLAVEAGKVFDENYSVDSLSEVRNKVYQS